MAKGQNWEKIGEIVEKIRELGLSYKDGAKHFGVKPWLVYEYNRKRNRRAREQDVAGKEEVGGAGKAKDGGAGKAKEESRLAALPADVGDLIRGYRREHPSHGFKRIQDLLKTRYLLVVSRKQIRKTLKEAGLLECCDSSFDEDERALKGKRRFEAKEPGALWQMDVAYVYLRKIPVLYLVVLLDDHSRYCVGAELCRDQRAETLIAVFHQASIEHGQPKKLLTDQASGFYSWSGVETRFQEYLDDQKIEHLVSEPHSPQTQGKVERLIQTIRTELLRKVKFSSFAEARAGIQNFVQRYNFERPHQGIQGKRPADRFHGVVGEVEEAESALAGPDLDLSRGYLVYKVGDHRLSVHRAQEGLQVYLDGKLLREAKGHGSKC